MGKKTATPRKAAPKSAQSKKSASKKTASRKDASAAAQKRSVGRPRKNAAPLDPNDALGMLAADHRKVEQLFERFEQSEDDGEKFNLARQVCQELVIHAEIEEKVFYPACREGIDDDDMLDEAQVEHDSAKVLILDVIESEPGDSYYDAKVRVLAEMIKHHVREEEQRANSIFAKAQKAGLDLRGLAREMKALKRDLQEAAQRNALPKPRPRSLQIGGGGSQRMRDLERGQSERMSSGGRRAANDDDFGRVQNATARRRMRDEDEEYRR